MKTKLKKGWALIKNFSLLFSRDISTYFYKGWKAKLKRAYSLSFIRSLHFYLNQFRASLHSDAVLHHHVNDPIIKKLERTAQGLHTLLPSDDRFSYSILISINVPRLPLLIECIQSALNQTAPKVEILIGLKETTAEEVKKTLATLQKDNPTKIKVFTFTNDCPIINKLAESAAGNFLLLLGEHDWIRPDFLFRFEQTLRVFSDPEKHVLYCNFNYVSEQGFFIPSSTHTQPPKLNFPYFFKEFEEKGLLIPSVLWKKIGGLHFENRGAEYEELLLNLDLAGASFQRIPLCLYSARASTIGNEPKSEKAFSHVLEKYFLSKKLNWHCSEGYLKKTVRVIPPLPKASSIQVIIPYKDQKELTLKCLKSVLQQQEVLYTITAIDNRSTDKSIAETIRSHGGEVIAIDEPFNYSRLNNLAVKMTQMANHCDTLLFLNNDVELAPDAMQEMLRWIEQPQIGIVGCRLHYPNGQLQHGGVKINYQGKEEMRWEHIEKYRKFEDMQLSKTIHLCEAVTAACAMMKKKFFLEIGGFDETWYPIAYSDTHLAVKATAKGLKCLYTPYATGIHHESISRLSGIEDFENSWWLHHLLIDNEKIEGKPPLYYPSN